MRKKFKKKQKLILLTILIFIIGNVIGVAAYNIYANQVSYDNTTSGLNSTKVDGAIDELYVKINNHDCKKGYIRGADTSTGGYECEVPRTIYTINDRNSTTYIGQALPQGITTYNTSSAAMADFKGASGDADLYCLKHIVIGNNIVKETYAVFVMNSDMSQGTTIGTYEVRGGIDESGLSSKPVYEENKRILLTAFASSMCTETDTQITCVAYRKTLFTHRISVSQNGTIYVQDDYHGCKIFSDGSSWCG